MEFIRILRIVQWRKRYGRKAIDSIRLNEKHWIEFEKFIRRYDEYTYSGMQMSDFFKVNNGFKFLGITFIKRSISDTVLR